MDKKYAFPKDTTASILTSGLLGETYVGLDAGGDEEEVVHRNHGSRVRVEPGSSTHPQEKSPMFRILATLLAAAVPMLAAAQETPDALVKRVSDEVGAIIKSDKDVQSGNTTQIVELA